MSAHPKLEALTDAEEEKRATLEKKIAGEATLGEMFEFFHLQTRYEVIKNQPK